MSALQDRLAKQREKALAKRKQSLARGITIQTTEVNPGPSQEVNYETKPNLTGQAELPQHRGAGEAISVQTPAAPSASTTVVGGAVTGTPTAGASDGVEHAPVSPMANEMPRRQMTWEEASTAQQHLKNQGLDTSYDPNESTDTTKEEELDTSDIKAFLHRPAPKTGVIQCHIKREKKGLLKMGTYYLFLSHPETFLMSARKRKKNRTANYKLSLSREDLARQGDNYFGKVRANFVGTSFTMYDNGMNPKEKHKQEKKAQKMGKAPADDSDSEDEVDSRAKARREMGAVFYETNILGVKGPRKMKVVIPAIHNNVPVVFRPDHQNDSIAERVKAESLHNLFVLENKQPVWNDQTRAYVLNFNGRVSEASVKNFQLVSPDVGNDYIVLQFGKTGNNTFTMDVRYPLSVFQAFAIVLTSFDHKLGCD